MRNDFKLHQLHVDKTSYTPIAVVKEEDNVTLNLELFKDNIPLSLTGQTITLSALRSDKVIVEQTTGFTISNTNRLNIKLKNNVICKSGIVYLELTLTDSTGSMTTLDFYLKVNRKILGHESIQGSDNIASLEKIKQEFNRIIEEATINEEYRQTKEQERQTYIESEVKPIVRNEEYRQAKEQERQDYIENTVKPKVAEIDEFDIKLTKKIEKVYETINDGSFIPFAGTDITVDNSKEGYTKDLVIKGKTIQAPDNLQNIESVGDKENNKISILSKNKNLINLDKIKKDSNMTRINVDGTIIFNQGNNSFVIKDIFKANTQYVFSGDFKTDFGKSIELEVVYTDGTIQSIYISSSQAVDWNEKIIVTHSEKTIKAITNRWTYSEQEVYAKNLQLTEGEIKKDYIPPMLNKKEILIGLDGGLKSLSNEVCDTIEQREDGVYLVQRVGKTLITQDSDINSAGSFNTLNTLCFETTLQNKKPCSDQFSTFNGICSHFKKSDWFSVYNTKEDEEMISESVDRSDKVYIKINKSKLSTQDIEGFKTWLQANPVTVYYELANLIETKLDIDTINLETFKDVTYVTSGNSIKPTLSFKAPVDVPATISSLRIKNNNLEKENKELKEDVEVKTTYLHEQDMEIVNSNLDLDFRLFEIEMLIDDSVNMNSTRTIKGVNNMARTPFEMMKILILNNNYDREDIEYKASKYLKGNRITQAEYDELISLMDANEIVK